MRSRIADEQLQEFARRLDGDLAGISYGPLGFEIMRLLGLKGLTVNVNIVAKLVLAAHEAAKQQPTDEEMTEWYRRQAEG